MKRFLLCLLVLCGTAFAGCESVRALSDDAVTVARDRAERLLSSRGKVEETLLNPLAEGALTSDRRSPEQWIVRGVPEETSAFDPRGVVFRHYIQSEESYRAIVESGKLLSAFVPYVQVAPYTYYKNFVDLTGVFLTTPDAAADSVGLAANTAPGFYVDVTLDPSVPVLRLERDIYVVPLPARFRDWQLDVYRRWKAGEKLSGDYERMAKRIEEQGGDLPALALPIRIVSHGRL